jgi:hypothetical protein
MTNHVTFIAFRLGDGRDAFAENLTLPAEKDLQMLFEAYGSCHFEYTVIPKYKSRTSPPNFGHVIFYKKANAESALKGLQGYKFDNGIKLKLLLRVQGTLQQEQTTSSQCWYAFDCTDIAF